MVIRIDSISNGCYLDEHRNILLHNVGKTVQVIEHDEYYYKSINCGAIFLIHKKDCTIIRQ